MEKVVFSRVIDLDDVWEYIIEIARQRTEKLKTPRQRESGGAYDKWGCAGEMMVRRYLGLVERLHVIFDGGVDIPYRNHTFDARGTEVKNPRLIDYHLQWPHYKDDHLNADYVIQTFVWPEKKHGIIAGFTDRETVLSKPMNHDRAVACREVPVSELRSARELFLV